MSELEVIKKVRSTLITAPARPTPSPRILATAVAGQAVSGLDELRQLAMRLGLTDEDIRYCYETRDSYDWCLVLLGAKDTPPSSPVSPNLNSLIMKLLTEGKVDPQRMRALGLSKYLSNLVVEKLSNIVERAKSSVAEHRKPELAAEIDKVQRMYRGLARFSNPALEHEILKMVAEKCDLPPRAEEVVLNIIKGGIQPALATELLIDALGEPGKQEENAVAKKTAKRAQPVGEGAFARAQSPRGA